MKPVQAMDEEDARPFQGWVLLELLGHRKLAGFVREEVRFGAAMCRIDVPEREGTPGFTAYYGASSIYAMTPVGEAVARKLAESYRATPFEPWDLPREVRALLQPPVEAEAESAIDDDDDRPF